MRLKLAVHSLFSGPLLSLLYPSPAEKYFISFPAAPYFSLTLFFFPCHSPLCHSFRPFSFCYLRCWPLLSASALLSFNLPPPFLSWPLCSPVHIQAFVPLHRFHSPFTVYSCCRPLNAVEGLLLHPAAHIFNYSTLFSQGLWHSFCFEMCNVWKMCVWLCMCVRACVCGEVVLLCPIFRFFFLSSSFSLLR